MFGLLLFWVSVVFLGVVLVIIKEGVFNLIGGVLLNVIVMVNGLFCLMVCYKLVRYVNCLFLFFFLWFVCLIILDLNFMVDINSINLLL